MWRYNSGRTYTLRAANQGITAVQNQILGLAGYTDAPALQNVYYGALGAGDFKGYGMFDGSVSYDVALLPKLRPWVKLDVFNLFNNQKVISWNTTIRQDASTPRGALGLRTGYINGPLFGQPTSNSNYPTPFAGQTGGRTLRLAVGFRF
jgi:hypothetical protein